MEREGIYEIHCNRIIASSISTLRLNPTYCSAAFLDSDLLLPSPNSSIAIVVLNKLVLGAPIPWPHFGSFILIWDRNPRRLVDRPLHCGNE